MIENRPFCDRACPFCSDHIENEFNFLIKPNTEQRVIILEDNKDMIYGFHDSVNVNFYVLVLAEKPIDTEYHPKISSGCLWN